MLVRDAQHELVRLDGGGAGGGAVTAHHWRLLADERSNADWLSVDEDVDLVTGRLELEAPEL